MNPEINTRISRDWFDMKNTLTETEPPLVLLNLEPTSIDDAIHLLGDYAEGGLISTKEALLASLFTTVNDMGFRGMARKDFPPVLSRAALLVLITWGERFCLENPLAAGISPKTGKEEAPPPALQEIVNEISVYARNNPGILREGGHVTKALKLLKVLQEEQAKTKQILEYPENKERRAVILSNFKTRLVEMEQGIRAAYAQFKAGLEERTTVREAGILATIDRTLLGKCMLHQLRNVLELHSALSWASAQTTGLKDVHKHLMLRKGEILDSLEREKKTVHQLIPAGQDREQKIIALQNELRFLLLEWLQSRRAAREQAPPAP